MLPASTMDVRLNDTLSYVMDPIVRNLPDLGRALISISLQIADVTGDGYPDIIVGASLRPDSTQTTFVRVYNNVGHLAGQYGASACAHNADWTHSERRSDRADRNDQRERRRIDLGGPLFGRDPRVTIQRHYLGAPGQQRASGTTSRVYISHNARAYLTPRRRVRRGQHSAAGRSGWARPTSAPRRAAPRRPLATHNHWLRPPPYVHQASHALRTRMRWSAMPVQCGTLSCVCGFALGLT